MVVAHHTEVHHTVVEAHHMDMVIWDMALNVVMDNKQLKEKLIAHIGHINNNFCFSNTF